MQGVIHLQLLHRVDIFTGWTEKKLNFFLNTTLIDDTIVKY